MTTSSPRGGTDGRSSDGRGEDGRDGAGSIGGTRVTRLWDAIRRTRLELESRERRDGWIAARFDASIRPREQALTEAVRDLTERLVTHHEGSALGDDERGLLVLWIDENLSSLATHPFAPRESTDALTRRWRRHPQAAPGVRPASFEAVGAGADAASADGPARPEDDGGPGRSNARDRAGRDRSADERDGRRRRDGRKGRADRPDGRDAADEFAAIGREADERRSPERVVSRLFRRLARVLHPDREPDEARRRDKHELMSTCLRARKERDVDTLLSLYVRHVGALPADLVADDPPELVALLRRQLVALQIRLRSRVANGGALGAMIVARYAAPDRSGSERLFAAHASALDGESGRVAALADAVRSVAGLREALVTRRALALDRLVIDELTGLRTD